MPKTFKCPNCGAPLKYDGGPDLTMECPYCKSPVIVPEELRGEVWGEAAPLAGTLDEAIRLAGPLAEIARLVRSGRKIEAVTLYRQTFHVGLQEAKVAVDKIARGEPVTMTNVTVERVAPGKSVVVTDVAAETLAPARADQAGRRVKRSVATIIVAIVACLVDFALIYAVSSLPLRLHPVYRTGMELVKNDPAVIELFGSPVRDSLLVLGRTEGSLYGGEMANLQGFIAGPRARGTVFLYGTKNRDGTCSISSISIRIGDEMVLTYNGSEPEKGFQFTATRTQILPTPTPEYASAVLQFGGEGIGPGWFQDARSIAVDGAGHIYVAEYEGGRVQVFDPTGTFITQWSVGDAGRYIYDMPADRRGTVYVVAYGTILRVEGATGRLLGELTPPDDHYWFDQVALTPDGGLLALDENANLVRFDAEGRVVQVLHEV
ncbi:MAG: hypothetical protein N2508_07805, partial [Anaerolineae bacterium]|nr:hypothetical protein [Anaerolineae bacterium]